MTTQEPCIKYEDEFSPSKLETVKIEKVDQNGQVRTKKVPVFTAKVGVEGLFHVIDKYKRMADRLALTVAEKWDQFDDVLDQVSEKKWDSQTKNIAANQRTNNRFDTEIEEFIQSYAQDPNPKDILLKYIKDKCKKPYKKSSQEHADRMISLISFANELRGTEPDVDEDNRKKIIFESFPNQWQLDFKKSGKTVVGSDLTEIISYMNLCKGEADEKESSRKRKASGEPDRL